MLQFPRWRVDVTVGGDLMNTFYETATTSKAAISKAKHKMRGAVSSAGAFKFKATRDPDDAAKTPSQLDREIADALAKDYRVLVRVEGAPKPVHISPWMTLAQAEHAAKNHKAMIRDRGWTQVVEIENANGTITRVR